MDGQHKKQKTDANGQVNGHPPYNIGHWTNQQANKQTNKQTTEE
jgi:hypothetical protein